MLGAAVSAPILRITHIVLDRHHTLVINFFFFKVVIILGKQVLRESEANARGVDTYQYFAVLKSWQL